MPIDFSKRRHLLAVLGGGLVGVIAGLFLPIRASAPPEGNGIEWQLPPAAATSRFDEEGYQSLKTASFWDTQAGSARGRRTASSWTPRAIMVRPLARVAVTVPGSNRPSWVAVGGSLPDGTVVLALDRDTVWFEQGGCRKARKLYASSSSGSEETECVPVRSNVRADAPETRQGGPADAANGNGKKTL